MTDHAVVVAGAGMCSTGRSGLPGIASIRMEAQPPAATTTAARNASQAPASTSTTSFGPGWLAIR